jgi:hypothetical protein
MHNITLIFNFNYSVFDMFVTSKCSSSGTLVHAVCISVKAYIFSYFLGISQCAVKHS